MGKIKDINDLVNATFQVKKFFRDTKKQYNLNYEEIYILNHKSSPDSCVKCYTMFLPFLLIKIDVF
ncbi:MarR family transcriptional regulator, partial [Staphylococcus epidermidis]|nr:MarR family transcriptional regulator [Staphylococcus epidermidis]